MNTRVLKKALKILAVPLVVILSKTMCFAYEAFIGAYYGVGDVTDAFIMAASAPSIVFGGINGAICTCFIPIYQRLKYREPHRLSHFYSNILNLSMILGTIMMLVFLVFKEPIMTLFAPGFVENRRELMLKYSGYLILLTPFVTGLGMFKAFLQVNDGKAVSNISHIILYSVLTAVMILTFPNDMGLVWGHISGDLLAWLILLLLSIKQGFHYRPVLSIKEDYLKVMLKMMIPVFLSSMVGELAGFIDRYFSSFFESGIITSMSYGHKLSFSIQGIIASSAMVIMFPSMAEMAAREDYDGLRNKMAVGNSVISWLMVPLVIGGFVLGQPIVDAVFGHGQFNDEDVRIVAGIFEVYMLGVLPMCIKHVGDKTCYALGKTDISVFTSFCSMLLNFTLNFFFRMWWGYMGLVWATGIAITATTVLVYFMLWRHNRKLVKPEVISGIFPPLIPGAIMGVCVYFVKQFWEKTFVIETFMDTVVMLCICVCAGAVIYAVIGYMMNRNLVNRYIKKLRGKKA